MAGGVHSGGGVWWEVCVAGGVAEGKRRPLKRALRILLECFLVNVVFTLTGRYYKAYPSINCKEHEHLIKGRKELRTIQECNDACDSTPGCAAYGINNDWRSGCWLKKKTCLGSLTPHPQDTLFVK